MTTQVQLTESDIEQLLPWSKGQEKFTRFGPRLLRTAKLKDADPFWDTWRLCKATLKEAGISLQKDDLTGSWRANWWKKLDAGQEAEKQATEAASRATDADIQIPCPEGLAYMPFQRAGIHFAMLRPGTLIGDDMGLGKTIQGIGVINALPEIKNVLILTKASLKINWSRECLKWIVRKMSVGVGDSKHIPSADVVILNYDVLLKQKDALRSRKWDLIICDEVQYIKNRKATRTQALIGNRHMRKPNPKTKSGAAALKKWVDLDPIPSKYKLALTGTPIENRPDELWTILFWLCPDEWRSYWTYAKRYCGAFNDRFGWHLGSPANMDELRTRLRQSLMIRRLKTEVLTELPDKIREVVTIEPTGDLLECIKEEKESLGLYEDELSDHYARIELAKASDEPQTFEDQVKALDGDLSTAFHELARLRSNTAFAKVPHAIEFIEECLEETPKILVFAHHRRVLEALGKHFGPKISRVVHGQTPLEARDEAVQALQKDPNCRLFFGSIRATGEGLTLTAATLVLFVEEDWVPGKMTQCEDRAYRIGQKDTVVVRHLVVDGSMDAKMATMAVYKQETIDQALDKGEQPQYEEMKIKVAPVEAPTLKQIQIEEKAEKITDQMRWAIHKGLQMLAGVCNWAQSLDGQGFNKFDARIGHELASLGGLTKKQAVIGQRLIVKYGKQLPEELVEQGKGTA